MTIADTRIVVNGYTIESDGKTESGVRTIPLDGYTGTLLRRYLMHLDRERAAFGAGYPTHGSSCDTKTGGYWTQTRSLDDSTGWSIWPECAGSDCTTSTTHTPR